MRWVYWDLDPFHMKPYFIRHRFPFESQTLVVGLDHPVMALVTVNNVRRLTLSKTSSGVFRRLENEAHDWHE